MLAFIMLPVTCCAGTLLRVVALGSIMAVLGVSIWQLAEEQGVEVLQKSIGSQSITDAGKAAAWLGSSVTEFLRGAENPAKP